MGKIEFTEFFILLSFREDSFCCLSESAQINSIAKCLLVGIHEISLAGESFRRHEYYIQKHLLAFIFSNRKK